jgi:hypothetical protein
MMTCFICGSKSAECGHREALEARVAPNYQETHRKSTALRRPTANGIPRRSRDYEILAREAERKRTRHPEQYVVMVTDWNGASYKWGYSELPDGGGVLAMSKLVSWVKKRWVERA